MAARAAIACALVACLSGCASLLGGGATELDAIVENNPPGVAVRIVGQENEDRQVFYRARVQTKLARASSYMVLAEAPDYLAAERLVARRLSWWLLADIALGLPLIGLGWPLNVRLFPGGPDILSAAGTAVGLGAIAFDLGTGSAWTHDRTQVRLHLEKAPSRP